MNEERVPRAAALALLAAAAVLLVARLGATGLWAPDEPRYGHVAQGVFELAGGPRDLVLLRLNDEPYTQKPPLYYWLAALCSLPGGEVSELSARLPSALAGLATLAVMMALGARLLGASTALLGAALLLTTWEFAYHARRVQLDVLLTLFETLALLYFWRFDRGARSRATVAGFHACMGLAVLTKGPVGLIVPALVVIAFLVWERRARDLRRLFPAWGFALSALPALAWVLAAGALAPSGFLDETVGTNLIGRFFAGTSHERPFYYYTYQGPLSFVPWTLLVPIMIWAGRRRVFTSECAPERRRSWRFLLAWVAATFVFFSLSTGKRGVYVLPCVPALALLCADSLRLWLYDRERVPRSLTLGAGLVAAALLGLAVHVLRTGGIGSVEVPTAFAWVLVASVVASGAAWWLWRARPLRSIAVGIACVFAVELAGFCVLFPSLDATKSPAPIAHAAARVAGPEGSIGLLGDRALTGGLVFYSGRHVVQMEDINRVQDYFDSGGRALVVAETKLERVRRLHPIDVRARLREGDRTMLVVSPSGNARPAP